MPSQIPEALKPYREEELISLRGDNVLGKLEEHDRIYGYDFYNDLGDPENNIDHKCPVLGTEEHPYPRRCRTGRPMTLLGMYTCIGLPLLSNSN